MGNWHSWCNDAMQQSVPQKTRSLLVGCVSMAAALLISASISAFFYIRWVQLSSAMKSTMWRFFGWFSALLTAGFILSLVSVLFTYFSLSYFYKMKYWPGTQSDDHLTKLEKAYVNEMIAYNDFYWVGQIIPQAISIAFYNAADFLILERLSRKVFEAHGDATKMILTRLAKATVCVFGALHTANVSTVIACSVYNILAGTAFIESSQAFYRGDDLTGREFNTQANVYNSLANQIQGYMSIIECAIMIGTIILFVIVGAYVWRAFARIAQVLPNASTPMISMQPTSAITPGQFSFSVTQKVVQAGLVAQKRTQRIVAAVFLLLLFRAAYALLFTVAFAAFDMKSECDQCGECQSTPTVMGVWFISNPSVQIVTSFLSAPAALLLAMFGMLSNTNFQMLTRSTELSLQMLERNSLDAFM